MNSILVTGGTGYIGSHTTVELLKSNYNVIIVDNLRNSKIQVLDRIERICQRRPIFYKVDLLDEKGLAQVFQAHAIDAVVHFAGLKAVGESTHIPLQYYSNNITGTLVLCELMSAFKVNKLVFSSSATVYGDPQEVPVDEDSPLSATNPYGRTKLMIEEILRDICVADPQWSVALLRYFNPVGAHASGLIGEDPNGIPNNLMPFIAQVAVGKLAQLSVFGDDYPTPDGSGVRDYIHVVDLALGHIKALEKLAKQRGAEAYNLGAGRGYSVFEVIRAFEKASERSVPYKVTKRRSGDIAMCYADVHKAQQELGWAATRDIDDMCADAWRWQSQNPGGYVMHL
ncbi:UDP-glucose 4-epimerase GalE [candidate division KSB1 bacterium]|nr:UDP-glucose 4-epimerase GalE [candidate division KSB1 bacterium]RQW07877.1 MAG: UDP-glucose 4-epimerase GalE [candidate division KSB1 bacterium]